MLPGESSGYVPEPFGSVVLRERLRVGIPLREFSRMTGLYTQTITAIENGSEVAGPETRVRICQTLGLRAP